MQRPATAHLVGGGTGQGSPTRNERPLLLVGGATTTVRRLAGHPHLGRFTQPRSQNDITDLATSGLWWGADNNALQGLDPDAYLRMLDQIAAADRRRLLFVTAPDAARMTAQGPEVSCEGTLWLFRSWLPALRNGWVEVTCLGVHDEPTPLTFLQEHDGHTLVLHSEYGETRPLGASVQ